jgi:hypothetical protein
MGGWDGTILERRNSSLTDAVAVFYFLPDKLNLLASLNLLDVMCPQIWCLGLATDAAVGNRGQGHGGLRFRRSRVRMPARSSRIENAIRATAADGQPTARGERK